MNDDEVAAVWVGIDSLTPWDKNPRKNAAAISEVAESIKRFGFASPIIARKADSMVIAGHTRLEAAKRLKLDRVPVRFVDLDPADARLLALADNKLGEIADWDTEVLAQVMRELEADGALLDGLGWDKEELDGLLGDGRDNAPPTDDDVPEPPTDAPDSTLGTTYCLGPHRLLCGDSTLPESWGLVLLPGEKLQAVWQDPPYGVSYVGKTADALQIENDTLAPAELEGFLRSAFAACKGACEAGAPWYVAAPSGPKGHPFSVVLFEMGLFRQRLAWVKDRFVLGLSDYHYRHEDVYYGYVEGADGRRGRLGGVGWFGDHAQDTVMEVPRPSANREHPTMKPLALIDRCLQNSTKVGTIVGDPFGGSGSTMMACAASGRIARLIELDPRYCDVIRRRWTKWATENNIDPGPGALHA